MRVAVVPAGSLSSRSAAEQLELRQGTAKLFAEQGFIERRNLALEYVDFDPSDMAEVERRARAVIARRPDVILVAGDNIGLFARLTKDIPIVFYYMGFDPLRAGYVQSYSRPGGNVTGIMFYPPGHELKGWELLKEMVPNARRIGVLEYQDDPGGPWTPDVRSMQLAAASRLGLELVRIAVPADSVFAVIERAIRDARIDLLAGNFDEDAPWTPDLMRFLERSRIPAAWSGPGIVRRGGLLSAGPSWAGQYTTAVTIVARVLRGASPATIPVHAPTSFTTAINLRTARAMGLTVPASILLRADVVVDE
jgi:putative ABC transport system substrate-binding protein